MKKVLAILLLVAVVAAILVSQDNNLVQPEAKQVVTSAAGTSPVPHETDFASITYDHAGEVVGVLPTKYGSVVQVQKYGNIATPVVHEYRTSENFHKGQGVTISFNVRDEVVRLTA